jgi:hypothetical protein
MLGYGILQLRSSDRSTDNLRIVGLPDVDALAEQLRSCVLAERARPGVRAHTEA